MPDAVLMNQSFSRMGTTYFSPVISAAEKSDEERSVDAWLLFLINREHMLFERLTCGMVFPAQTDRLVGWVPLLVSQYDNYA